MNTNLQGPVWDDIPFGVDRMWDFNPGITYHTGVAPVARHVAFTPPEEQGGPWGEVLLVFVLAVFVGIFLASK